MQNHNEALRQQTYHELYQVVDFEVVGDYTLRLQFDDGSEQVVNLEPILHGEIFEPLRDPDFFRQVRLDPILATVVWPNGADIDPEILRNWPAYRDDLIEESRQWMQAPS